MLYSTTDHFLEVFGLNTLGDMPPLREIEAMVPASQAGGNGEEPENVKTLKKLVREMTDSDDRIEYDPREDEQISKDIRDQVKAISITTPYLEEMKNPPAGASAEDPLANAAPGTQGEIGTLAAAVTPSEPEVSAEAQEPNPESSENSNGPEANA
jgi:hypothetical protein